MHAIPKKSKAALSIANSRGILCSDHAAKAIGRAARSALVPYLQAQVGDLQSGAVPGGTTDYPSHTVRLFLANARISGVSAAALFTDLRAAFYSILPEVAYGSILPPGEREIALARAGLDEEAVKELCAIIDAAPSSLEAHGVDPAWRRLVTDWHRGSWFAVPGSSAKVHVPFGCRPGDPLADITFALAFLAFQRMLTRFFAEAGLDTQVEVRGGGIFPEGHASDAKIPPPTFMDDLTALLQAADAVTLVANLALATRAITAIAAKFGMQINSIPARRRQSWRSVAP